MGLLCTQLCPLWSFSGSWFPLGGVLSALGSGFLASAEPVLPVFCSVRVFAVSPSCLIFLQATEATEATEAICMLEATQRHSESYLFYFLSNDLM